jgi:hypothetical protein
MSIVLSGSLILTGSISASGNLTTLGTITAQTLVVQTITSSIVNMTGSNRFGGQLTDRQTFTGSVLITGSLTVNTTGTEFQVTNNGVVMGNLLADSHSVTGSLRVTGSGTFTSTISAIGESTLFQGAYNDPVPNTVAVLKMSSIPTPSLASTVVGARMSGSATANVDTYAGYFSNISTVSGTGLSYGIFATASFHTFIGETRFAQGVFNDPINGTVASIKISATPRSGAPTAVFTTGITGTASSGQNTFAGYFTNTSTVSGGGVNYGIYATGSNHFFGGNVGIGTTSPSTVFHLNGSTPRMALITTSGALSSGFYDAFQILAANQTGGGLSLNIGKAESQNDLAKMVYFHTSNGSTSNRLGFGFYNNDSLFNILASGNVGFNTTSPTGSRATNLVQVAGSLAVLRVGPWFSTDDRDFVELQADGANTRVYSPNEDFSFHNPVGNANITGSVINICSVGNTNFFNSGSEKMRITSGGKLLIGTTSAGYGLFTEQRMTLNPTNDGITVAPLTQNKSAYTLQADNNTGTRYAVYVANASSAEVGSMSFTSTAVAFNTTSDYRLKQDFKDFKGLDLISSIKTYDFEWKINGSRSYGVIAHELQEVVPYIVINEKDGSKFQSVDYSKLVPILTKAIQEQQILITELTEKVRALENK